MKMQKVFSQDDSDEALGKYLAISYFICLENLDKIRRTHGPAPTLAVDNNTPLNRSVAIGNDRKKQKTKMRCQYGRMSRKRKGQAAQKGPLWDQGCSRKKRPYPFFLRKSMLLKIS